MTGSIAHLALAALAFVGSHFLLSSTGLRQRLAGGLGERGFVGLFSALALLLFAWLIWAYAEAPYRPLWTAPPWLGLLPVLAMPLALLLLVGGFAEPNPTAVPPPTRLGASPKPPAAGPAGILAVTRHPVMWGIGLWALAHIPVNGDAASLILFGALALLALLGTRAIDAKKRRAWGGEWDRFAAATSNLPFVALAAGRARLAWARIGVWRIALAAALYLLLILLHPVAIGVPALPH